MGGQQSVAGAKKPVVLVTGCSKGGIGFRMCEEFHKRGCVVYATARRLDAMSELKAIGIATLALDVTSADNIKTVFSAVLSKEGRIDILVNNAAAMTYAPALETDLQEMRAMYETNVMGPMAIVQAAAESMIKNKGGKILNVGSVAGFLTTPFLSCYCSTKAALRSLTDGLRMELKPFGVDVCYVAPGSIKSELNRKAQGSETIPATPSLYSSVNYKAWFEKMSRSKSTTPTEKFAAKFVAMALRKRLPAQWVYGHQSGVAVFMATWMPTWVRHLLMANLFQLNKLSEYKRM